MTVASIGASSSRQQRRAGDAGARRDPRPLPRGGHAGSRGPRRLSRLRAARSRRSWRRRAGAARSAPWVWRRAGRGSLRRR
jgi:hypothetical protein